MTAPTDRAPAAARDALELLASDDATRDGLALRAEFDRRGWKIMGVSGGRRLHIGLKSFSGRLLSNGTTFCGQHEDKYNRLGHYALWTDPFCRRCVRIARTTEESDHAE